MCLSPGHSLIDMNLSYAPSNQKFIPVSGAPLSWLSASLSSSASGSSALSPLRPRPLPRPLRKARHHCHDQDLPENLPRASCRTPFAQCQFCKLPSKQRQDPQCTTFSLCIEIEFLRQIADGRVIKRLDPTRGKGPENLAPDALLRPLRPPPPATAEANSSVSGDSTQRRNLTSPASSSNACTTSTAFTTPAARATRCREIAVFL